MATTSYRTLPSSIDGGLESKGDFPYSTNYGFYNPDIGSLSSHQTNHFPANYQQTFYSNNDYSLQQKPQYYLRDRYAEHFTYNQEPLINNYANPQTQRYSNRLTIPNHIDGRYTVAATNHRQPLHRTTTKRHQTSYTGTTQPYPSTSYDHQQYSSRASRFRPEYQISNNSARQPLPIRRRSLSNSGNSYESETTTKRNNFVSDIKTTRSNNMRAAAIKQKEDIREQKQMNGNYFSIKKNMYPYPSINGRENDISNSKRNKNQSNSVPRHHITRRHDFETEDNTSSFDEDNNHLRNKSLKRTTLSESTRKNNPVLPPVRRGQGPFVYDPAYSYPLPYGHPLRSRYPYYDGAQHRHSFEDVYNAQPNSYNRRIDYDQRKLKSKSDRYVDKTEITTDRKSVYGNKNNDLPYYDERDTFETSYQERNDDPKMNFIPTIYDISHTKQWTSAEGYLENQRRRALRDAQGYYFPYKKYTIKDYKDLQKTKSQYNVYGSYNGEDLDRKERQKKRQEYAAQIERRPVDVLGEEQATPRNISPRKSARLNNGEPQDSEKSSKRDRALEYGRVQQGKQRLQKSPKNKTNKVDPTEQYINNLFPEVNEDDDSDGNVNEQQNKNNDSHDDEDAK